MPKPWTAAGTEAAASFVCDGVDETVSDMASLRSLSASVYNATTTIINIINIIITQMHT